MFHGHYYIIEIGNYFQNAVSYKYHFFRLKIPPTVSILDSAKILISNQKQL